ncbi:MAG: PKD domain-containing protein [Sphingobacteriales bacterium]|nr:PKD domain-containing protein [Sphingobacteriales bacterium]
MRRHFLTEDLNLFVAIIGYFTKKNFTLKRIGSLLLFVIPALVSFGQGYENIEFIQNKGQWDSHVQYKGNISNGAIFIREGGFTVLQHNPVDFANLSNFLHGFNPDHSLVKTTDKFVLHSQAWNVDFIGASPAVKTIPEKIVPTYNNYFIGNDPSKWSGECRLYQAITMKDVYPNVDVRYYTDNGFLKYDIIVKPGGDVSKIALKYNGTDKLQVKNKDLLIKTSFGELKESLPYSYQADITGKKEINCKYVLKDNVVRFQVKEYDPASTLIIDPVVIFGSFSGSSADNWGFTATYGPDESMFGGGIVFDNGFPVSTGAFQTIFQGGNSGPEGAIDIGIIKLSPDGRNRIYATYIGGNGNEQPHSLIADAQGNLVIAGRSNSGNYPVTSSGSSGAGFDIVVTKLNASGTALIGSKKIGGNADDGVNISASRGLNSLQRNYGDDGRSEIILDGAGNIYVASSTHSANFPVTPGVFQNTFGGGSQDAVILKLTPNVNALMFASYFGGTGNDAGYVLSLGPSGNIYMAGGTESGSLPGNRSGTIGPTFNGNIDGYVTIVNNNGTAINRTTYIGTSGIDQVFGVQFDLNGFPYIMGQTTGSWPIVNAAYSNSLGKQFIAKLQPDLSSYVYSTAFGSGASTPNISPIAFLVDKCQNVYISGWGGHFYSNNAFGSAGTGGLPVTPDAIKSVTDGKDMYFFVLKRDAASQLFGSFYGENNNGFPGTDHVDGGTSRFDAQGKIYQAICGNCKLGGTAPNPLNGLVTSGSWSTTNNASSNGGCNLTMIKIAMNLAGVLAGVQSAINGVPRDTAGCVPLTVDFSDTIRNAQSYIWDFGDGSPQVSTTNSNISHVYNAIGTYRVMLIAIDPNSCNIRDTSYLNIKVGDLKAILAFNPVKLPPCDSFKYRFDNLSIAPPPRPFGPNSFIWDFGDGTPTVQTGSGSVFHNYAGPGTYNVKLILPDTAYCNSPDTLTIPLSVAANVKAQFTTPSTGCLQYNAVFTNTSIAGQTFEWDFGDGSPISTQSSPTHVYTAAGTYNIVLVVNNPNTCNLTDTARFTITVFEAPTPDFSFAPIVPVVNTPTTFTNLSSADAIRFRWDFGDGDSLITTSRLSIQHQYNATGTFNACLTAYNAAGCDSTICKQVQALIDPLVDVPNAFTPLSGDANSVVYVRGFGIGKMTFTIWNRWGQKVFVTNNRFQGWDGRLKGVVQPMDVYAYTLSIEFTDGSKTTKKGDITLIR